MIAGSGSLSQAARRSFLSFLARFFGCRRNARAPMPLLDAATGSLGERTSVEGAVSAVGEADCRRGFGSLAGVCNRVDRRFVARGVSSGSSTESPRSERVAASSTTRLGRIRPLGGAGAASARGRSGSFDSNTASAARCVSRSNADRTGAVSNRRPFALELEERLGCRRTSTVNEGVLRLNLVLDGSPRLRRLICPKTTLLGKTAESNMRLLQIGWKLPQYRTLSTPRQ